MNVCMQHQLNTVPLDEVKQNISSYHEEPFYQLDYIGHPEFAKQTRNGFKIKRLGIFGCC